MGIGWRRCLLLLVGLLVLAGCGREEGAPEEYALYAFDGETKETEQLPFAIQIPDREGSYIQSMDVRDGIQISFRMRDSEGDFLVITDIEGKIITQEQTFPDQEEYPWNAEIQHRFENRVYDTGKGSIILGCCRAQENVTELFLYDANQGSKTPLSVFDGELVRALCTDGEDTIYYTTLGSLNRWDRGSNTHIRLLELHENGLESSPVSNNLLINSQGEVLVCELERDPLCLCSVRRREPQGGRAADCLSHCHRLGQSGQTR